MTSVEVRVVGPESAAEVHRVVQAAFGARPALDPPTDALAASVADLAEELTAYGGLLATLDGVPVGALTFDESRPGLGLRRVGVVPDAQGRGVAGALDRAAEREARDRGQDGLRVEARLELPETVRFWEHHGLVRGERDGTTVQLARVFPWRLVVRTAEDARDLGKRLAGLLRAGDLVILTGDLGAGKTTLTQGIGAGLGVRGDITSPTFVIARVHPSLGDGPALVHADAYRLGGIEELDDLDLDTSLADAVTVVEWGEGLAEGLADERLEIRVLRTRGEESSVVDHDPREVVVAPVGLRWLGVGWPLP
jgi:tRNA threonylcarbamoyladenosine biosynthesis protein TsaE